MERDPYQEYKEFLDSLATPVKPEHEIVRLQDRLKADKVKDLYWQLAWQAIWLIAAQPNNPAIAKTLTPIYEYLREVLKSDPLEQRTK